MSENFSIKDLSSHKYFSMIPNVIYEIDLKASEIAVYGAIKRCAGENGMCTKSQAKLAKHAGVCVKTIFNIIQKLCDINKILNKPLIKCTSRLTEHGDKDTNIIEIIDIWPECTDFFKEKIGTVNITGPHVNITSPTVNITEGVRYPLPDGPVTITDKEEFFKKNLYKKTTTTVDVVVVHKEKILQEEEKKCAKALKDWIDNQATKIRKKNQGYEFSWGIDWIMPIETYETLVHRHGNIYVRKQLEHIMQQQQNFDRGKSKTGIKLPETFLKRACKDNYADSQENKKETK